MSTMPMRCLMTVHNRRGRDEPAAAGDITYFDGWARTYEKGPSNPVSLDDCPGTVVEIDIKARVEHVWERIIDINMPARFSEEFIGAEWQKPAVGAGKGAVFVGRNTHPMRGEWEVPCHVDVYREMSAFGWCTNNTSAPGARWRFELERFPDHTRLRFRVIIGPGPSGLTSIVESRPDLEPRIITNRLRELRTNMTKVLEGVKASLEQS